jgi:hypothetical protein
MSVGVGMGMGMGRILSGAQIQGRSLAPPDASAPTTRLQRCRNSGEHGKRALANAFYYR